MADVAHLTRVTHLMYALHAFSAVMGVISSAAVVTAFLTGWPSIIAIIINYVKRGEADGTFLESHFSWQLSTFWRAVVAMIVCILLFVTIIGIPFGWLLMVATGLWVLYRIARGWLALGDGRPIGA